MRTIESEIEEKVDELLACLETDVRQMQDTLWHLNELRGLVIKRDDAALGKLLEGIQAKSDHYASHERRRRSKRRELAKMLGCRLEQITLTALAMRVPENTREQITTMQAKLRSLADKLKKEHMSTTMLLSECARFNNLLLRSVFDLGHTGAVYYNSNGAAKRQVDTALMNLEL
ncbi:MAG: hypothetical protein JSW59_19680 [Phycisphaerales bacterium]|nr:MAG: hypothetical protein JSW59_19680 [Phycisphaerales bacterium]